MRGNTCTAALIVALIACVMVVSQNDDLDYWRKRATEAKLWTDCRPPIHNERLMVTLRWHPQGSIPAYSYQCMYLRDGATTTVKQISYSHPTARIK